MKLVVGLGNPGKEYQGTRHNVGFDVLRLLAERWQAETPKQRFESFVAETRLRDERALLIWPQTYMNKSGRAVRMALDFYKAPLEDLLVICDDFHLPTDRLRLRGGGSSGGQNGLKDVADQLGEDGYSRLRIGVGPVPAGGKSAVDFVLGRFSKSELESVSVTLQLAADATEVWANQGLTEAMNRYNGAAT
ncbi:aminoacyl-tRNA hydrolase [Botrimarina hoheduenensis]|uniref:Peptidyl-tRNA hydrolase n=1 Tax=Botrimarina hoheduenensis TaxID=2528000 RepID=A0A5C5W9W5_9BACT|nr:aminoacyl-tRNA hydrolase [Botrimarina hoheduenensis]TWT47668.1 Peptidyl-tRNA hydrolase [Botrimarina hoheduenensis]